MDQHLAARAAVHAALGDPTRLAIVDALVCTDRSPSGLAEELGIAGNLLAHHLRVLEGAGVIERTTSSGDHRRRYVRLRPDALDLASVGAAGEVRPVVFVCTQNSARSQLASALWERATGDPAHSAGTDPAAEVHPGAVEAAARAGLDLTDRTPTALTDELIRDARVVTVCDRAHEQLGDAPGWWHWSVDDPVEVGDDRAFDEALAEIDRRIRATAG